MNWGACLLIVIASVGCKRESPVAAKVAEPEPHPESLTNWTTRTELFMEYPPLVAGQTSRFAVHLTRLDTFKPVAKGRVEIRLIAGKAPEVFLTDAPSRPGIFGVDVKPSAAREYRLSVLLKSDALNDVHELGEITVSATKSAAVHEQGPAKEETIAFLKEQQWTLDFGTAIVEDRQLKSSLRVPAEVIPRSGGEAEVTVPFDGRLVAAGLPVIGAHVTQGQALGSILPPISVPADFASLELVRNEANLALQLARKDRERAERLVASGAAPAKRLDEARTVEATAEARLKTADIRIAQYEASSSAAANPQGARLFALRSPITGVVVKTSAAPGANVKAGETLFKIVDLDTVYVSAIVPEADLPQVRNLNGAELEVPGTDRPRRLQRLISVGRIVDPASRTFPVIYEVDNRDRRIAINQTVNVRLLTAVTNVVPVVPESALVDDGGRPVIFIQQAGETFLRRPVKLGVREGGVVQALEGVSPGERVVTRGAHLIRLSTMSSQVPAHGHVH
jgi:cobalt-zinc-cadmium efflux system membrane fusion protein